MAGGVSRPAVAAGHYSAEAPSANQSCQSHRQACRSAGLVRTAGTWAGAGQRTKPKRAKRKLLPVSHASMLSRSDGAGQENSGSLPNVVVIATLFFNLFLLPAAMLPVLCCLLLPRAKHRSGNTGNSFGTLDPDLPLSTLQAPPCRSSQGSSPPRLPVKLSTRRKVPYIHT